MTNAIAARLNYRSSGYDVPEIKFTDAALKSEWQAQVLPFTKHQLAKLSGLSTQATTLWLRGERAPSASAVLNLARALPSVREWLIEKIGHRPAQAMSADAVIRWAHEARSAKGMDGDIARAVLRSLTAPEPEEKPAPKDNVIPLSSYTPDGAICHLWELESA